MLRERLVNSSDAIGDRSKDRKVPQLPPHRSARRGALVVSRAARKSLMYCDKGGLASGLFDGFIARNIADEAREMEGVTRASTLRGQLHMWASK